MVDPTSRKLFVALQVKSVATSRAFFSALGFQFNEQFSNEDGACLVVSDHAYFMLLVPKKLAEFIKKPVSDAAGSTEAIYSFSCESRAAIDLMANAALTNGGSPTGVAPQDHGFMYSVSFQDPDGHHLEAFWMNQSP